MTKKVKEVRCGTCSRKISKRDEIISIATKKGTTAVFHATAEGCSKASTISAKSVGYRQVPSHSQLQLATLSISKWDE
jgi:hypothetical protein